MLKLNKGLIKIFFKKCAKLADANLASAVGL